MAAKIRRDDEVIVLTGKDKGKRGKVKNVLSSGKVIVEGINIATCHVKPKKQGDQGGIINREIPMYASKGMLVCPKCGKALFKKKGGKLVCMTAGCGYEKSAGKKKSNE